MAEFCPNCGASGYEGWECINCLWDPDQEHFQPHWMKKEQRRDGGYRRGGMTRAEWEQQVATGWRDQLRK